MSGYKPTESLQSPLRNTDVLRQCLARKVEAGNASRVLFSHHRLSEVCAVPRLIPPGQPRGPAGALLISKGTGGAAN